MNSIALASVANSGRHRTGWPIEVRRRVFAICVVIGVAAACSDGTTGVTPTTSTTSTRPAVTSDTANQGAGTTAPEIAPTAQPLPDGIDIDPIVCMNLDPCTATMRQPESLADGDVVSVRIEGWSPEQWLGIAQCADPDAYEEGTITLEASGLPNAEFCNVKDIDGPAERTKSDAAGTVAFEYEVVAGQRMADRSDAEVSCDADHPCLLNVFVMNDGRFNTQNPRVTFPLSLS
jgi:hypothetical protein